MAKRLLWSDAKILTYLANSSVQSVSPPTRIRPILEELANHPLKVLVWKADRLAQ